MVEVEFLSRSGHKKKNALVCSVYVALLLLVIETIGK